MSTKMSFDLFTNPERDPEDRMVDARDAHKKRDKMFDKTGADSFPASDPPSTLPDPSEDSFSVPSGCQESGLP